MIKSIIKSVFALNLLMVLLTSAFMAGEIWAELKLDELVESGIIDREVADRYYGNDSEDPDALNSDSDQWPQEWTFDPLAQRIERI